MLRNTHRVDLGNDEQGNPINDVELPPWATDAKDFIEKMRSLLEGEYVSSRLH
jgi:hypothetical protein